MPWTTAVPTKKPEQQKSSSSAAPARQKAMTLSAYRTAGATGPAPRPLKPPRPAIPTKQLPLTPYEQTIRRKLDAVHVPDSGLGHDNALPEAEMQSRIAALRERDGTAPEVIPAPPSMTESDERALSLPAVPQETEDDALAQRMAALREPQEIEDDAIARRIVALREPQEMEDDALARRIAALREPQEMEDDAIARRIAALRKPQETEDNEIAQRIAALRDVGGTAPEVIPGAAAHQTQLQAKQKTPPVPTKPLPPAPLVDVSPGYNHPGETTTQRFMRHAKSLAKTVSSPFRHSVANQFNALDKRALHHADYKQLSLPRRILENVRHPVAGLLGHTDFAGNAAQARAVHETALQEVADDPGVQTSMKKRDPASLWTPDLEGYEEENEGVDMSSIPGAVAGLASSSSPRELLDTLVDQISDAGASAAGSMASGESLLPEGGIPLKDTAGKLHDSAKKKDARAALNAVKSAIQKKIEERFSGYSERDKAKLVQQVLDSVTDIGELMSSFGVPFAGVVSGLAKAGSGAVGTGQAVQRMHRLSGIRAAAAERQARGQKLNAQRMKTLRQARGTAQADIAEGVGKAVSGVTGAAADLAGNVASFGAAETPLKYANTAIDAAAGLAGKQMNKNLRHNVLEEELNLTAMAEEMQRTLASQDPPKYVTLKEARQLALKKAGYATGKKKEAFLNITMDRAYQLAASAERPVTPGMSEEDKADTEEAKKILQAMGLGTDKEGRYSRQAIAEKLGIEKGQDWQAQMQKVKEKAQAASVLTNPFKRPEADAPPTSAEESSDVDIVEVEPRREEKEPSQGGHPHELELDSIVEVEPRPEVKEPSPEGLPSGVELDSIVEVEPRPEEEEPSQGGLAPEVELDSIVEVEPRPEEKAQSPAPDLDLAAREDYNGLETLRQALAAHPVPTTTPTAEALPEHEEKQKKKSRQATAMLASGGSESL
jgi:hypothetical protein